MRQRIRTIGMILLILGVFTHITVAENTGTDMFAQNLIQSLERYNWETSEVGNLERYLYTYEWKNLQGVDPAAVAQALSYGKDHGNYTANELAEIAFQLSESAGEMIRLGFESRDIMLAATDVVRTMTNNRVTTRTGEQTPDLAQTITEQLRLQLKGTQESSLQQQTRSRVSRPERADTWTPPAQQGKPGGGTSNIPGGPSTESQNGNGGR